MQFVINSFSNSLYSVSSSVTVDVIQNVPVCPYCEKHPHYHSSFKPVCSSLWKKNLTEVCTWIQSNAQNIFSTIFISSLALISFCLINSLTYLSKQQATAVIRLDHQLNYSAVNWHYMLFTTEDSALVKCLIKKHIFLQSYGGLSSLYSLFNIQNISTSLCTWMETVLGGKLTLLKFLHIWEWEKQTSVQTVLIMPKCTC